MITLHVESDEKDALISSMEKIHAAGKKCGITLKPGTAIEEIADYLDIVDMVLVMTVEPGFGGQKFMSSQMDKVRFLRDYYISRGKEDYLIEVDGGIDKDTAPVVREAGANVLVAGSAVFCKPDRREAIESLRK